MLLLLLLVCFGVWVMGWVQDEPEGAASRNQKRRSLEVVEALGVALGELDTAGLIGVLGAGPKNPVAEAWNEYFAARETAREGHYSATLVHTREAIDALDEFAAGHGNTKKRDQIIAATAVVRTQDSALATSSRIISYTF